MSDSSSVGMGQFSLEYGRGAIFDKLVIMQYMQDLLHQIDDREQETVTLYFFNSMSLKEIADFVGRPKTTIAREKQSGVMKVAQLIMRDRGLLEMQGFFKGDD